ncbi:MAG TPA: hypothetical protein VG474_11000 [Solirubrobacteraceae bacterium]|nr:hypothetical protein [Solirubrobacteraceae bacterium]
MKLLEVGDAQTEFKSLTAKIKSTDPGWTAHLEQLDTFKRLAGLDPRDRFQSPGHATWKVGDAFGGAPRASLEKVRKAWATKVVGPSEDQLKEYLKDKGIVPEKKYALLWVRLSAKRRSGGAHPELDTSVQGVRDLKAALKEGGRDVIIVGDRPNKTDVLEDAIDMVEFWNDDAFKAFTGLQGRLAQLRLFDYMVRKGYDVVSIGMRSGAMEGPALLGMPTVYIEEQGNLQHERMEKWLSKVPGWTQAQVAALPTRTGRRTQQPDRTATFPVLDKRQRDAVGAVSRELRKAYEWTRTELIAAYDPDETAFKTAFAKAVGQRVCQRLGERLDEWHRAYDAWAEAWWELDTHEKAVAALTGLPVETVRDKLRTLRGTATSVHKGLADFVREALASLGVEHTKELAAALATWRSQYSGKVSLSKGFDPEDVTLILQASASAVTQARFARVKREQAVLLGEIDELTRMRAGAAAKYVDRNVTAKPAADEFRGGWLSFAVDGLKQKLALGPTTPLAEVQNRFKLFIREGDGQTWNQLLTAKLSTLHGLLYPA